MATTDIFINATDARQNPIREHVIHDEGRAIESAILDAVAAGYYSVIVSNGTPMTQSTPVSSSIVDIDPTSGIFYVPNHGFSTGNAVQVSSTGTLPSPLVSTARYFIIYVDPNNVKLATTLQNALSGQPVPVTVSQGVNGITLVDQGGGYLLSPTVSFSGGDFTTSASALAYLATYGEISSIAVISHGAGYTDVPSVSITPQGSGAAAGTVALGLVSATVANGGANYRLNDTLTVTGGTGTAGTLIVTQVDNSGSVQAVSLNSPGSYTALPSLSGASTSVTPGGGSACTLNLNMGVVSIAVSTGGAGYAAQPLVVISGTGTNAAATALVVAGSVTQVNLTNPGSGYTCLLYTSDAADE